MGFFSNVGSFFKKVVNGIRVVVPDEQFRVAVRLVETAALSYADNSDRREFVVAALVKQFKIPESLARWLTETAVQAVKQQVAKS